MKVIKKILLFISVLALLYLFIPLFGWVLNGFPPFSREGGRAHLKEWIKKNKENFKKGIGVIDYLSTSYGAPCVALVLESHKSPMLYAKYDNSSLATAKACYSNPVFDESPPVNVSVWWNYMMSSDISRIEKCGSCYRLVPSFLVYWSGSGWVLYRPGSSQEETCSCFESTNGGDIFSIDAEWSVYIERFEFLEE